MLACAAAIAAWKIWMRFIDTDAFTTLRALLDGFEMSRTFFADFTGTLYAVLPIGSLVIFTINTILAGYAIFLLLHLRNITLKGRLR